MNSSYRIKANIGSSQVLNVNLKQDVDIYEILSLSLNQKNFYKLFSSNYGVIVGRVLANNAFGVPNAKITVFIPIAETDANRNDINSIYPYKSVTDYGPNGTRYNVLPNYRVKECYQEVGSFPSKRLVLDDDSILEVYDKYYKYTTVTNQAGDYMIFGVPVGEQILHLDVDLSDIGVLSQTPRDFIYKGYSIDLFESPTQFKKGTNLDSLPQIHSQNESVYVYPFWGDNSIDDIAITRKDINISYEFEPTCVFLGSVVTDNGSNSVSHNCIPDKNVGDASQLTPSAGNIEMIRKTIDDRVEEFPIKGNKLIDGDGVWCYQIPMNLDYVGMDEHGNIVPTNNPNKGIPTRTRVRFRFSLDENGDSNLTRHSARFLVPNNPELGEDSVRPIVKSDVIDRDLYYEFGTLTPDECFRDLYWNKVYSVKAYIPRIQLSKHEKSENYLALKGVNKKGARKNNPIPFNKLNLNFSIPSYYILHSIREGNSGISGFWRFLKSYSVQYSLDAVRDEIIDELDAIGLDFYNDWLNGCLYFPSWFWKIKPRDKYEKGESVYTSDFCECSRDTTLNDGDGLYLVNNCSLVYEPPFETDTPNTQFFYNDLLGIAPNDERYNLFNGMFTSITFGSKNFYSGLIKRFRNKDGAEIFYYTFGNILGNTPSYVNNVGNTWEGGERFYPYARLFSTDIILLGSLQECDLDGVPMVVYSLPSTTSNIPPIGRYKYDDSITPKDVKSNKPDYTDEDKEEDQLSYNGMNWGNHWSRDNTIDREGDRDKPGYKYIFGSGLFFGLTAHKVYNFRDWATNLASVVDRIAHNDGVIRTNKRIDIVPYSDIKTCINAERISELGVTLDSEYTTPVIVGHDNDGRRIYNVIKDEMDGLITNKEIEDIDTRAWFATLNSAPLIGTKENWTTGYKTYNLRYLYPTNFDGRMELVAPTYTMIDESENIFATRDDRNKDYLDFRFGSNEESFLTTNKIINNVSSPRSVIGQQIANILRTAQLENPNADLGYAINDGSINYIRRINRRTRHFYGYTIADNVYPLDVYRGSILESFANWINADPIRPGTGMSYAFPLYNNSFYFYFGINKGSTAIDKFYKNFYSKCVDEDRAPFIMHVTSISASACLANGGSIMANVEEINMPYDIELYMDGDLVVAKRGVNLYRTEFKDLRNGTYTVKIIDANGNVMEEEVVLSYQKVALETNVIRGISTEYMTQTPCEICNNDYYGKLEITNFTLYGNTYEVTGLTEISEGTFYLLSTGLPDNKVGITLTPRADGSTFNDFTCDGCTPGKFVGNVININRPVIFDIEVFELCNGTKCDNVSYYTVKISDVKALELYINTVPLKYIVGDNEDLIERYNRFFHNGTTIANVQDVQLNGWFGLHNPDSYSQLFRTPFASERYRLIWYRDNAIFTPGDVIKKKLEYMFSLSSAAYITKGGNNYFVAELDGGEGEPLLRSAFPKYEFFSAFNTEGTNGFNSYLTSEKDLVRGSEANANIVSENYRRVDDTTHFPIPFNINGYDFNPKYAGAVNNAGNYFAGFSNSANIIQNDRDGDTCIQRNIKPYTVIPYRANDLYNNGMCLFSSEDEILANVYKTYRYFRTEFIDRRFDYDAFYITGHRGIHFDIDNWEYNGVINYGTNWDKGRISALTYNGIEMTYTDDNSRLIVSQEGDAEYNYTLEDAVVTWNSGSYKRFYESKLYYGDGKYVELVNAYQYAHNPESRAYYFINGINGWAEQDCTRHDHDITGNTFHNFGFDGVRNIYGYPSNRWLDYHSIPYGDFYQFKMVGCSYDNIIINETQEGITAKAVPGETVSYTIEACELINLVCGDFETDYQKGYCNVWYSGETNGSSINLGAVKIYDLPFRLDCSGSTGFLTRIENLGLKICWDDNEHNNMNDIKTANSMSVCEGIVNATAKLTINDEVLNDFDTSEKVKNKIFNVSDDGLGWEPEYEFINMFFDRTYYSQAADSLMKRIRTFNLSTIYNVSKFIFTYERHDTKTNSFEIPAGDIDINSSGTIEIPDQGEVPVDTEGSNEEPIMGDTEKHDYTEFSFDSKFISACLSNVCFKISFKGTTAFYKLGDNNVGIVSHDEEKIKFCVIWRLHDDLLEDYPDEQAEITVYMKIENKIKSANDNGYMGFAFAFKISNTKTTIDECIGEKTDGGMVVPTDGTNNSNNTN